MQKTLTFIAPRTVAAEASLGLQLRRMFGRGGTAVGIARARDLAGRRHLSERTIKRMHAFFSRHQKNRLSTRPNGDPGNGMIAWLLWGGDSGREWAREIVKHL